MKKIGILTFHRALNYGAVLQTYALEKKLGEIGAEYLSVEVVDYRNACIEHGRSIKARIKPFSVKRVLSAGLLVYKKRIFNNFLKKHVIQSGEKYCRKNIEDVNKEYEALIVGSDQVWNYHLTENDNAYLLDFVSKENKRYSYAASMGLKQIGEEVRDKYVEQLKIFDRISVRENDCAAYLKELLNKDDVQTHVDPTLLLRSEEWKKIAAKEDNATGYILVYNVPKPDYLFEIAEQLSKETGLRIKFITNNQRPKGHAKDLVYPSVEEFLRLFADASYVITNSFHGTVFSIIFHRPMLIELKEGSTAHDRIITLLSACGLQSRVSKGATCQGMMEDINWELVDERLARARERAVGYLKTIVEEL